MAEGTGRSPLRWPRDAHEAPRGAYRCAQKFCSSLLMDRWLRLRGSGFRGQATRGSWRQKTAHHHRDEFSALFVRHSCSRRAVAGAFTANKCQVCSCSDVPWALPARSPEHSNAYFLWMVKPIMDLEARNVSTRRTRASGATTITWSQPGVGGDTVWLQSLDGTSSPILWSIGVARPDARAVTLRGTLTDVFG